jgi:hypothetical protein
MQSLRRAQSHFEKIIYTFKDTKGACKGLSWARHQWLTPVILATQEAEIRRIEV